MAIFYKLHSLSVGLQTQVCAGPGAGVPCVRACVFHEALVNWPLLRCMQKCGPRASRSLELLKEDALSDFFLISNDLVFQCRLKLFLIAQPNKTLMQLLESAGGQFVSDGRHLCHIK